MKNKKISESLKKYHYKKKYKKRQMMIKIFLVIYLIALSGIAVKAEAPFAVNNNTFPVANDKTELTTIDRLLIVSKGFEYQDYLIRLAYCESRLDEFATNMNGGHSLDRGIFQINKMYHPEVSDECSFNLECSAKWTMEQILAGKQSMWMCDKIIKITN